LKVNVVSSGFQYVSLHMNIYNRIESLEQASIMLDIKKSRMNIYNRIESIVTVPCE